MELLFGGMQDVARFVVAFMLVLGLIGAGALFWRRFGAGPLSLIGPRSRQPRIAVIDAASVDARRQLVLIRRDNAEHLIMIGGPTDIVIEPNITRTGTIPVQFPPADFDRKSGVDAAIGADGAPIAHCRGPRRSLGAAAPQRKGGHGRIHARGATRARGPTKPRRRTPSAA